MVRLRVAGEYSPATLPKRDAGQHFRLNLCDLASPDFSAARLVGAAGESGTTLREIRGYVRGELACPTAQNRKVWPQWPMFKKSRIKASPQTAVGEGERKHPTAKEDVLGEGLRIRESVFGCRFEHLYYMFIIPRAAKFVK
jgi:hypothetical protein